MAVSDAVVRLVEFGFFQFIAPFSLIFLLTYGILLRYKPFGDWKDNTTIAMIYGISSFLAASFVLLFGLNVYIEQFLAWVLGRAGIIVILLFAGLIIAAFGMQGSKLEGK